MRKDLVITILILKRSYVDSSNESGISESVDYYVNKDKITKWTKIKPRLNVRTLAHNIVKKLPEMLVMQNNYPRLWIPGYYL